MTIKKAESGWLIDIQPGGRGHKRIRKTLPTKVEVLQFEAWAKIQVAQNDERVKPKKNLTKLSELIDLWQSHRGIPLRHTRAYSTLLLVCEALGNPLTEHLKSEHFAAYRATRLAEGFSRNTINREHAYLRAVFSELIRLGFWQIIHLLGCASSRSQNANVLPHRQRDSLPVGGFGKEN